MAEMAIWGKSVGWSVGWSLDDRHVRGWRWKGRAFQRLGVTLVALHIECSNKRVHDRNGRLLRLFIHGFRHSKLAASLMSPWPW